MSRFLDAVNDMLEGNSEYVYGLLIPRDAMMSEAFRNIVKEQGEPAAIMTYDSVAKVYTYFGEVYFDRWFEDDELSETLIKRILINVVNDTDFSNLE